MNDVVVRLAVPIVFSLGVAGCAWVSLSPEGEKTRVLSTEEARNCEHLGKTTVSVKAGIGSLDRSKEKVAEEFEILARNSASDLGGDTVVPDAMTKEGKQVFQVYKCVP